MRQRCSRCGDSTETWQYFHLSVFIIDCMNAGKCRGLLRRQSGRHLLPLSRGIRQFISPLTLSNSVESKPALWGSTRARSLFSIATTLTHGPDFATISRSRPGDAAIAHWLNRCARVHGAPCDVHDAFAARNVLQRHRVGTHVYAHTHGALWVTSAANDMRQERRMISSYMSTIMPWTRMLLRTSRWQLPQTTQQSWRSKLVNGRSAA